MSNEIKLAFSGDVQSPKHDITGANKVTAEISFNVDHATSNKVTTQRVSKFEWDSVFMWGHLIAVHKNSDYVAYAIKGKGGAGCVRVINRKTSMHLLLKDFQHAIADIAFAFTDSPTIAIVDHSAHINVYTIVDEGETGRSELLINLQLRESGFSSPYLRLSWCPGVVEEGEEESGEDYEMRLLVSHAERADFLYVSIINEKYGNGLLKVDSCKAGLLRTNIHTKAITAIAVAPDCEALATAGLDGTVNFFQATADDYGSWEEEPKLLHQWIPHDGAPLSSLYFLDNHLNANPDTKLWIYALSGSRQNTELKLWACVSWSCLKTIQFTCPSPDTKLSLKPTLHLSSKYLVLSDLNNSSLYALEFDCPPLFQDPDSTQSEEDDQSKANIVSMWEFKMSNPVIDMAVVDVIQGRADDADSDAAELAEYMPDQDDEYQEKQQVALLLYSIHQRALNTLDVVLSDVSAAKPDTLHAPRSVPDVVSAAAVHENITTTETESWRSEENSMFNADTMEEDDEDETLNDDACPEPVGSTLLTPEAFFQAAAKMEKETSNLTVVTSIGQMDESFPIAASPKLKDLPTITDNNISTSLHQSNSRRSEATESFQTVSDDVVYSPTVQESPKALPKHTPIHPVSVESVAAKTTVPPPLRQSSSAGSGVNIAESQVHSSRDSINSLVSTLRLSTPGTAEKGHPLVAHEGQGDARLARIESVLFQLQDRLVELDQTVLARNEDAVTKMGQVEKRVASSLTRIDARYSEIEQQLTRANAKSSETPAEQAAKISATIQPLLKADIEKLVKAQFRSNLTPALQKSIEQLKTQIENEMAQKLTATNDVVKESVGKMCQSKAVLDELAKASRTSIHQYLESDIRRIFAETILPSFEQSLSLMFDRMASLFQSGTENYLKTVEMKLEAFDKDSKSTQSQNLVEIENRIKSLESKIDTAAAGTRSLADDIRAQNTKLVADQSNQMLGILESIKAEIRQQNISTSEELRVMVKEELARALREHSPSIPPDIVNQLRASAVATPIPTEDKERTRQQQKRTIQQLISSGKFNEAFMAALQASDLAIVNFVCETVPTNQIFTSRGTSLQQPVLLSLISQLASDLPNNPQLKYSYLEEAVMHLDPKSAPTANHLPRIITDLRTKVDAFMKSHADDKTARQFRMLKMAANDLLNQQ